MFACACVCVCTVCRCGERALPVFVVVEDVSPCVSRVVYVCVHHFGVRRSFIAGYGICVVFFTVVHVFVRAFVRAFVHAFVCSFICACISACIRLY